MTTRQALSALTLVLASGVGCAERDPSPAGAAQGATSEPPARTGWRPAPPPQSASPTAADPEASDVGLMAALAELRKRTRCNDVSGCPAEDVIRGYGARAAEPLAGLVRLAGPRTPWLPRALLLLGEIADERGDALIRPFAEVEQDGVRAAALLALVRRGEVDPEALERDAALMSAAATSRARLTARWALARGGDAAAQAAFVDDLVALSAQMVAADSVRWGLGLCREHQPPSCTAALVAAAKHPSYLVRREVLRLIEAQPLPGHGPALLLLLGDPTTPLRRDAEAVLRAVTGERHGDASQWPAAVGRWQRRVQGGSD